MDWESLSESAVGQLETHPAPVPPPVQLAPTEDGSGGGDGDTPPEGTNAGDGDTPPEADFENNDAQPQLPVWEEEWVHRLEVCVQVHVHIEMGSGPQGLWRLCTPTRSKQEDGVETDVHSTH